MKNLTIKKVALGVFLAGYAASGAFALTATTNKVIMGNQPYFVKNTVSGAPSAPADREATFTLTKDTANTEPALADVAQENDTITFKFKVYDADGDLDSTAKGSTENFTFYYKAKDSTGSYTAAASGDYTSRAITGGVATIEVKLSAAMVGATAFAYRVTSETQYGLPDKGDIVDVNISTAGAPVITPPVVDPGTGGVTPGTPTTPPGEDGGTDEPTITPGGGGVPPAGSVVRGAIFANGASSTYTLANNYSVNTLHPKYGEKFDLVVWTDRAVGAGSVVNEVDASEIATIKVVGTDAGELSAITWAVDGAGTDAGTGNVALTNVVISATQGTVTNNGLTYELPTTNTAVNASLAGIQGYNLVANYTIN